MTDALPCIACGKRLENALFDVDNQPYGGTAFVSFGHYGSTFFDPMDGQNIEINVCDLCLAKHTTKIGWRRARNAPMTYRQVGEEES